jgi:hypothetical protein
VRASAVRSCLRHHDASSLLMQNSIARRQGEFRYCQ